LADFINDLDEYSPTIPDAVALHYMEKNGVETNDPKVVRLLSLAAQKLVSDIALDAMQQAKLQNLHSYFHTPFFRLESKDLVKFEKVVVKRNTR
jgi:hypothetical protein